MAPSPHNEDLLPTDDETDSTSDADTDSLYDSSGDETDITRDADTATCQRLTTSQTLIHLPDDEDQHPPEYYLSSAWPMLFLLELLGRPGAPFAKNYCIYMII